MRLPLGARGRRVARGTVALGLVTACSAASVPPVGPDLPVAGAAAVLTRTLDVVPPRPVLLVVPPAASTTVKALPPVPVTLSTGGIPARAVAAYRAAAARAALAPTSCTVPWVLLAGIGFVESGHGSVFGGGVAADGKVLPPILGPRLDGAGPVALIRDTDGGRLDGDTELDRAVGPMQFIPSTWARNGADGDGDGVRDPHDLDDAAQAAAGYLCVTSRRLDQQSPRIAAIYSYNHSYDYVRVVLTAAARYAGQSPSAWGVDLLPARTPEAVASPSASASPSPSVSAVPSAGPSAGGPAAPGPSSSAAPSPVPASPPPASPEPAPDPLPVPSEPGPSPEPSPTGPVLLTGR